MAASGMAGVDGGEHFCSGRSTGTLGHGVLLHGRTSCRLLRSPADSLSTGVGSDASCMRSSYGGAMAGGGEFSDPVGTTTTWRNRARGERGTKEKLTANQTSGSVAQGRLGGDGATMAISGGRAEKMSSMTRLQGVRGPVVRRRGARQRGRARGRDGWEWGGRWPRRTATVVTAPFGGERSGTEEGTRPGESERGSRGLHGIAGGVQGADGAARQGAACRAERACAPGTCPVRLA